MKHPYKRVTVCEVQSIYLNLYYSSLKLIVMLLQHLEVSLPQQERNCCAVIQMEVCDEGYINLHEHVGIDEIEFVILKNDTMAYKSFTTTLQHLTRSLPHDTSQGPYHNLTTPHKIIGS
jgi:hypothetical protein